MNYEVLPPEDLGFPYEDEMEELIQDLSAFETRVRPKESHEDVRVDLNYGWQAVLYQASPGLVEKSLQRVQEPFSTGSYRNPPEYEWELETPNGEIYRIMGLDISSEVFERLVREFREDN